MTELQTIKQPMHEMVFADSRAWDAAWKQAQVYFKSGFLPSAIKDKEQCFTIMMMGSELGLSPMTSLMNISVIKGKPTLEVKLQLALVKRKYPNLYFKILQNTAQIAEVEMGLTQETAAKFSFTIEQARQIGLLAKDNWKNFPADMLYWRAVGRACRSIAPDALMTISHSAEELEPIDITPVERPMINEKPKPKKEEPKPKPKDAHRQPPQPMTNTEKALKNVFSSMTIGNEGLEK